MTFAAGQRREMSQYEDPWEVSLSGFCIGMTCRDKEVEEGGHSPYPKKKEDTDKGTSYRPIYLLSVIAKTLEKSLLLYITANIANTPMQHGYTTLYSDGTTHTK